MGRSVVGEDILLTSLKKLSSNSGYSCGLILGQSTTLKDYIVHFAPSLPPPGEVDISKPESGDSSSFKDLGDYDDTWIASHTRYVMKMLPGGMSVLGVFITCPSSSSDTLVFNKLRTLAIHSYNSTKNNQFLELSKNSCRLLLQYSLSNKKFLCKSLDAASLSASLQPVDLKFTNETLKWYTIDSSVNLMNFGSHFINKTKENHTLKKMLKEMLAVIQSKIESCECSVNRKFVNPADELRIFKEREEKDIKELEKSTGKKFHFDSKSLIVQLFDRQMPDEFSFKIFKVGKGDDCIEVVFNGDVSSKVFAIGSSTLADTIKAVKEDLIRCCSTKFEMHWETNDALIFLPNNNGRSSEEMHVLPRRVLFTLPDTEIQLSEYLFPDESTEDVIPSISENLGVQLDQSSILDVLEAKCDMATLTTPDDETFKKKSLSTATNNNNIIIISAIGAVVLALIISIFIQYG